MLQSSETVPMLQEDGMLSHVHSFIHLETVSSPISQLNFLDFYYRTLSEINAISWPRYASVTDLIIEN